MGKGTDYDFFKTLKEKLGKKEVIAEDLGYLTPAVLKMVKKTGYPGMKVLQFAFDPREESDYLPIIIPGTAWYIRGLTITRPQRPGWRKSEGPTGPLPSSTFM
mgnify:CR=1 FL=1